MKKQRTKTSGPLWSKQEVQLLSELYPKSWPRDLVRFFPKRNKNTIVAKAFELGLSSARPWKENENALLQKTFATASRQDLVTKFPLRSLAAILAQGERLGLKRERHRPRKSVNENYFKKWSANMAYLLGYILADGCITEGTYKGYSDALKFGVQRRDVDILKKIKEEMQSEHAISLCKNSAHLCITSQCIVNDLKKLDIKYRKSLREKIPNVPRQYVRDYTRGVIDGDGGISLNKDGYPTLRLCGGKATVTFVRNHFLSGFQIYSSVGKRDRSESGRRVLFTITYRGNPAKTLIEYLYRDADLYLDRKYLLAKRCMDLHINHRKDYSQKEYMLLARFYAASPKEKILSLLPNRGWKGIQQHARTLGMYKYSKNK